MRLVVFGATGGTGRAVVAQALSKGHTVTAFARDASKVPTAKGLNVIEGDAMNAADVGAAMARQDAVVATLGNSQNAFALRLGARRTTPRNICETATRHILNALPDGRTIPLVVVGAFGTGETRDKLTPMYKLFYRLVLPEQIADKERQAQVLAASGVPCVVVQPVVLTDKPASGRWTATNDGTFAKPEAPRADLAAYILLRLEDPINGQQTVTFSG